MSKAGELIEADDERNRGKQENMFITALLGTLLGAREYWFSILVTSMDFSAVFWFAGTTIK